MNNYFMGIDVSTTASKAIVIDETGNIIASHSVEHQLFTPYPFWSEQNPADWWQSTCTAIQETLKSVAAESIKSIGLTGQMHGLVTLDEEKNCLRRALLWNDQRSTAECEIIRHMFGEEFLYAHIGGAVLPYFFAPKLLWIKRNEPHIYKKIAHILLPKDYIRFCLSGDFCTDVSDASGTALLNISQRIWSESIINKLEIPFSWLPKLYESKDVCAFVNHKAAEQTGLKIGTPIVAGAGDQPAQSIGCGVITPKQMSIAVGTSGVTFAVSPQYKPELQGKLNTFCHALPNQWFYMGVTMCAAGSVKWLKENFAAHKSFAEIDQEAALVDRGAEGLLFAPYLSGERHPHADSFARGAFVGLTTKHHFSHLARAVLEGVSFNLRENVDVMRRLGINSEKILISGGAANSALWLNILANVMGVPLYTINTNEGAAFGAAILAAVGIKHFPSIENACQNMVKINQIIEPNLKETKIYRELYEIYCELYPTLKKTFHKLSQFQNTFESDKNFADFHNEKEN